MKVTKRNVEQFKIGELWFDRTEAVALYHSLSEALGVPRFENQGCGDRMSHGSHWHGSGQRFYCSGRSFDAT